MAKDFYLSISQKGESLYKEKGSKFLGFAIPIISEAKFKEELIKIKQAYHDSRHVCTAFRIGFDNEIIGKSDDGEPMHSAGDPILGQILAQDLINVGVFVVRYFGGTKLGVGGLKQAYKTAAYEAIKNAHIRKYFVSDELDIHFTYPSSAQVMKLIGDFDATIIEQQYDDKCFLKVKVRRSNTDSFITKLQQLEYLGIKVESE